MNIDIKVQIENIGKALEWVKKNRPNEYETKFLELCEERRKLRMIYDASENNPAIAAYGVSQVGKSYLMNCMLQKNGTPFMFDADGRSYNFIEEMNPKTKNTEATGVVTRFTSFSANPDLYSNEHPILMRCLSMADVILILSDGYYNDVRDYTTSSEADIIALTEQLYDRYKNMPVLVDSPIQPDDMLTINAYFQRHINNAQVFLHTSFFKKLALVADRIPTTDWENVFSILWNKSKYQTKLFAKMSATLAKFKYAKYVYLSPQALLHNGINEDTVMSVQCLNQLFAASPEFFTDVYLRNGNSYTKLSQLTKSEVCAVCAEIVVKIGEEYLGNTGKYYFGSMRPEVASKFSHDEVTMTILKENDMLDFPGARSRTKETLDTLESDLLLTNVFLRGKVAYLFNMYNESKKINILLYCHHGEKNEVTDIPLLLNNWIMNNIGETMEKRRKCISLTSGISPLFYVGTKFNMDMEQSTELIANNDNALRERWNARFTKVLYKECFNVDGSLDIEKKMIFTNWTSSGESFKNSYILRDFKYSGPLASKLYDKENTPDAVMTMPKEDYYDRMRKTFVESEHVKRFFADPALSWDVCASMNNDGALYIIENLSKIADTMSNARNVQFDDTCSQILKKVYGSVEDYFVTDDTSEILKANVRKAHSIFRDMEFTCESKPDFFGHILQSLQLTEAQSYKRLHMLIPQLTGTVTGDETIKDYELIRSRCDNFDGCTTDEQRWEKLIQSYRFSDQEEASEFLQNRGIDISKLFKDDHLQRTNSAVITDDLMRLWINNIQGVQFMNTFSGRDLMSEVSLNNLVSCIINTAKSVNLSEYIKNEIADYVDILNAANINQNIVADIVATCISDFVVNFGYNFLTQEQYAVTQRVAKDNSLPCYDWILRERNESLDEQQMTDLFNEILSSSSRYTPAYEANYNCWLEYMYIAFIANINVPEYDVEANNRLKEILESLKQ